MSENTKRCRVCGLEKPFELLVKDKNRRDGVRLICKACEADRVRSWRRNNLEKAREARRCRRAANRGVVNEENRCWRAAHPEKVRESNRRWKAKNRERVREAARRRRAANRGKVNEKHQQWRTVNSERVKENARHWRAAHPEKVREIGRRWRAKNREKVREMARLGRFERRVRVRSAPGKFTTAEWLQLKEHYSFRCLCCGRQEPEVRLTIDHVIPLILGGTNSIENIQPLCRSCNSRKGRKIIDYR